MTDEDNFLEKRGKKINVLNKEKVNNYEMFEYMTMEEDDNDLAN